ncbi:PREDICTED: uncharacterized protein LOC107188722 [Dufourea novaeangliae]|uniref:F-box only protein 36 n=1 Tax=Dufourea novaeangliae TaxID=178035 RepID=A0A154PFQ1_DUFNO|nr:PREDICTED: uncharacterized protein LOC107188722 [Dufourea novaeangliae]KZC10642.1 F-box only protein 36 [Dufourea novaeangliae]
MSGEIEYLEKYSVAPSPSRDYYGLKVLRDKVILYVWKISHGPHKTPLVRTSSFADFDQDKHLQDEIRRAFGIHLLKHVRNITSGRKKTLLTLPRSLIGKLVNYLNVKDVANLTSLSHVSKEIFDDNFVWETLYKKYRSFTSRTDQLSGNCTWKQLFQQAQIQGLMNTQKLSRCRPSSKQTKTNSKLENSFKISNIPPKIAPRPVSSTYQASKKPSEDVRKRTIQNPITRKVSEVRVERSVIETQKISFEKNVPLIKSLQTNAQKAVRTMRDQSGVLTRTKVNRENDGNKPLTGISVEAKSKKKQDPVRKTDMKVSSTSIKTEVKKPNLAKSRGLASTNSTKTQKPTPNSVQLDPNRPNRKGKTKKIGQSKSTILNTNVLMINEESLIRDDSFDFADLIEASLKNIRTPRSIFDYGFNRGDTLKTCAGDGRMQEEHRRTVEHPRASKSGCTRTTLDRLSEKSEPLTAKSIDSDVSFWSGFSKNSKTSKDKTQNTTELNKIQTKMTANEDRVSCLDRYGLCNKVPTSKINLAEQKTMNSQKLVDKMNVLRSLASTNTYNGLASNSTLTNGNRYEFRKPIGSINKH